MILFTLPINIIKCECWAPAFIVPLTCQQESFISNLRYSEAKHISLAHELRSNTASSPFLSSRYTGTHQKSTVRILACRQESNTKTWCSWLCRLLEWRLWAYYRWVSAILWPLFIHTSKGTCREERFTVIWYLSISPGCRSSGARELCAQPLLQQYSWNPLPSSFDLQKGDCDQGCPHRPSHAPASS